MSATKKTAAKAESVPAPDWAAHTEQQVLDAALSIVGEEGWTPRLAILAGQAVGLSAGETQLLLPNGPADLAALLSRRHDTAALATLSAVEAGTLKIRERIARAVAARIDAACVDEAAVRRLAGLLALPQHAPLGLRLTWESADKLWRWAGDTATDENHYSKRLLLGGILAGALAVRLTSGREASVDFTTRRIENVMAFEKWKATTKLKPSELLNAAAGALGRMRYGAS